MSKPSDEEFKEKFRKVLENRTLPNSSKSLANSKDGIDSKQTSARSARRIFRRKSGT